MIVNIKERDGQRYAVPDDSDDVEGHPQQYGTEGLVVTTNVMRPPPEVGVLQLTFTMEPAENPEQPKVL